MTGRRFALILLAPALVAGCGALEPFTTEPAAPVAAPAAGAAAPGPRVAICYNTLTTSLAEVKAQAQQGCGPNTVAEPAGTDWYLQYCPLLLPARATFACMAAK